MTPHVLEVGWLDKIQTYAFELSRAEFSNPLAPLYGVSIVRKTEDDRGTDRCTNLSDCFHSEAEALRYIAKLQEKAERGSL